MTLRPLALSLLAAPLFTAATFFSWPPGGPTCRAAALASASSTSTDPYETGIFFAVLEGLYEDGVSNEVVDRIVELDPKTTYPVNFVYACPICMPALDACFVYRGRPKFFGEKTRRDTFGSGLAPELVQRILGDDPRDRQAAIQTLTEGWVERRLRSLRLTEKERADWEEAMQMRRKKGMGYLEQYQSEGLGGSYSWMKECPFCEAANGASKAR